MPSLAFGGSGTGDDLIVTAPGINNMEYGAFAVIVRMNGNASTGVHRSLLTLQTSGNNARAQLVLDGNNVAFWNVDPADAEDRESLSGVTVTTDDEDLSNDWYIILGEKANGASTPRLHARLFDNGNWQHDNGDDTQSNWSPFGGAAQVSVAWEGEENPDARIGLWAVWNNRIPWSGDGDLESLGLHNGVDEWFATNPDFLVHLDTLPVTDESGNGGQQHLTSGIFESGVSIPGFDRAHTVGEHAATGGLVVGGTATVDHFHEHIHTATGGLALNGNANVFLGPSGFVIGGVATVETQSFVKNIHEATTGIVLGGDGNGRAAFRNVTPDGGLLLNGSADQFLITPTFVIPAGGLVLDGDGNPRYVSLGEVRAALSIEADLDNDGTIDDPGDIITSDVFNMETIRGRDYPSQLIGRSTAGKFRAALDNRNGQYSPFVSLIRPGSLVRVRASYRSVTRDIWTGEIVTVDPNVEVGPFLTANLDAEGNLRKLSQGSSINPPALQDETTGTILEEILDRAGLSASDYDVDTGLATVPHWYIGQRNALNAAREIEQTELGFIYEQADGVVRFEDRSARQVTERSTEVQFFFSDDPADTVASPLAPAPALSMRTIEEQDPLREIYNEAVAEVKSYSVGSEQVLWTLEDVTPSLGPGESITVWANYPGSEASGPDNGVYVDTWTTPAVGTDITQTGVSNGDIGVSVDKFAEAMKITITNNDASSTATLDLVQARGTPVSENDATRVSAENTTSQADFGTRTYELPAPWLGFNDALAYVAFVVDRYGEPRPILTIQFSANKTPEHMEAALDGEISDLVRVKANTNSGLGIDDGFIVENITHEVSDGGLHHMVRWELSFARPEDTEVWILGDSELETDTILGF